MAGITANNANFGSNVNITLNTAMSGYSFYSMSSCRCIIDLPNGETRQEYTTLTSVAGQQGVYRGTWTPSVETYAPLITTSKSTKALIRVPVTYERYVYNPNTGRTERQMSTINIDREITLTFTAAQVAPILSNGAFSITPINTGSISGLNGYIQGYSKIRASLNSNLVELKYGATITKWKVNFLASIMIDDISPEISSVDSGVIGIENNTVNFALVDSRGFEVTSTITYSVIPYQKPAISCTVYRCDSSGNEDEDGTYIFVSARVTYASLGFTLTNETLSHQNRISVKMYSKRRVDPSYPSTGIDVSTGSSETISGDSIIYTATLLASGFWESSYDIKVTATDLLDNSISSVVNVQTGRWIMQSYTNGDGFAIGKVAEKQFGFEIPSTWDYYIGPNKLIDVIYPIGSIYISTQNVSPAILFGGTWNQIEDTFLLAAGSTYAAGTSGGEAEVTLTAAQSGLPSHSHVMDHGHGFTQPKIYRRQIGAAGDARQVNQGSASTNDGEVTAHGGAVSNFTGSTNSNTAADASAAHNNMPPYIAVYMWERVEDPD